MESMVSPKAREVLLQDAIQRDLVTARRSALLEILWHERYLTRGQLISRVELKLGKNCFGATAWEDNFYRDMRLVKLAFRAVEESLLYSRKKGNSGYYLKGKPALSDELKRLLIECVSEADQRQIDIYHRRTSAQRFRQGCSISNTARRAVAYRILQENPGIDLQEANRIALLRSYSP